MKETGQSKRELASGEFTRIVDAISEFSKAVFPYGYTLSEKIKSNRERKKIVKKDENQEVKSLSK